MEWKTKLVNTDGTPLAAPAEGAASPFRILLQVNNGYLFNLLQILSYLLISASSAAATRVDEWVTSWGKDQFTQMASASIALAFLAFLAFAFSSLLSGYNLWTQDST